MRAAGESKKIKSSNSNFDDLHYFLSGLNYFSVIFQPPLFKLNEHVSVFVIPSFAVMVNVQLNRSKLYISLDFRTNPLLR